ncbi:uroporphyrinogen decarboxylase/cobalamine-independent methonine synthase family protein [Pseudonocardia dioxanivorans]|uniref:hypothetical protein n=1 Tax=Pseudonocardia dioxanivorans TaxID=240495 RepID=UPI0002DBABF4|nr:hypothetical protein [Pseudonocardia dioxanivorans]
MTRQLSDVVGHLLPTTQVGSYPRPHWNHFDLGGEDIRVALRRADFAEAFADGVRAMIGDQVDAGIDLPTDGHLWYDRHDGVISSFLLYPAEHLDGIAVVPETSTVMTGFGDQTVAAFGNTWNEVVVTGEIGRGTMHLAQLWRAARAVSPRTVKFCSGMGPANLGGWLTDHICHLGSGVPVGVTPYGGFHEMVARDLQVDAVEYAFAETGFPEDDFALWSKYPSEKGLGIGVIDIKKLVVESPEQIVAGVRRALAHVPPERIHLTTDCGQFALPRQIARGKLAAMAEAARILRAEIGEG